MNNLNDGLAWGIFPLYFVAHGLSLDRVAVLAGAYPLTWGALQLGTGWLSDSLGDRKSTRLNSSHIQKSRMPSSA